MPDGAKFTVRQHIPAYYHRNGLCYAVMRATLIDENHIFEDDCAGVVTERHVIDINEKFDLELAEFLMRRDVEFSAQMLA